MKTLLPTITAIALSLLNLTAAANNTSHSAKNVTHRAAPNNAAASENLSFVLTAKAAHLTQTSSGELQLLLTDVDPYVTYYTHRPNRTSGLASTTNFIRAWGVGDDTFLQDNPNAVFTATSVDGEQDVQASTKVLQLSNPRYSFAKSELILTVTPIGKNNQILIKTENFNGVALVIN